MTIYDRTPDFEAEVTIYSEHEGGRKMPVYNKIRWDFKYKDEDNLYLIYPLFVSRDGKPIDEDIKIYGKTKALMFIANEELKEQVHKKRIDVGLEFYMCEGARKVAHGIVTKIIGLND